MSFTRTTRSSTRSNTDSTSAVVPVASSSASGPTDAELAALFDSNEENRIADLVFSEIRRKRRETRLARGMAADLIDSDVASEDENLNKMIDKKAIKKMQKMASESEVKQQQFRITFERQKGTKAVAGAEHQQKKSSSKKKKG